MTMHNHALVIKKLKADGFPELKQVKKYESKLIDRNIKQLWNPVIAKYRDQLFVSAFGIGK